MKYSGLEKLNSGAVVAVFTVSSFNVPSYKGRMELDLDTARHVVRQGARGTFRMTESALNQLASDIAVYEENGNISVPVLAVAA